MTKPLLFVFLTVTLLAHSGANGQVTTEESFPFEEFLDPSTEEFAQFSKGIVALECAAIANRMIAEVWEREFERLLTVGYGVISEVVQQISLHPKMELSIPFRTNRELAAYMAGQFLGSSAEKLREEYMKSPEDDVQRFYEGEFEARNCFVVGR